MSEVLRCDGCGNYADPSPTVRRMSVEPWLVVTDTMGGAPERHACSPACLGRIADSLASPLGRPTTVGGGEGA